MSDEDFLKEIDKTGGWPLGYTHVAFHHGTAEERTCIFLKASYNSGWYTTVASSDDYYYWKLTEGKKEEILKKARQQLIAQLR